MTPRGDGLVTAAVIIGVSLPIAVILLGIGTAMVMSR